MEKHCVYLLAYLSLLSRLADARPEKANCDWAPTGQVVRMRDLDDCKKFYFCIKGQAPFRWDCPTEYNWNGYYYLYYNPNTTECDWSFHAPDECFGPPGTGVYVPGPPPTTTTTPKPTTVRPPRPEKLEYVKPDFEIDCKNPLQSCGLFADTTGDCENYIICSNGQKQVKTCNGGLKFDAKSKECRPESEVSCWTEPTAGPHIKKPDPEECPFHEFPESEAIASRPGSIANMLESPVVTDWGEWGRWQMCPFGTYATGINTNRQMVTDEASGKTDHAGIVSLSFLCQKPGGNETKQVIQSSAPGIPKEDKVPSHYMCKGAVVGIQLNSVPENGWGKDQLATDNVKAICSCSDPAYKPYEKHQFSPQNGNRGKWTAPQYCKRGQAVCSMQTQMKAYKEPGEEVGEYDNTGLNNVRVRCCTVPDPAKRCVPAEKRVLVRECDNSKVGEILRCDIDTEVGVGMDKDNPKLIEFYSSIGYRYEDGKDTVPKRIVQQLAQAMKIGERMEFAWDELSEPAIMQDATAKSETLYVDPYANVKIYQIVGACDQYLVRTNTFVKVSKGRSGLKETFFMF